MITSPIARDYPKANPIPNPTPADPPTTLQVLVIQNASLQHNGGGSGEAGTASLVENDNSLHSAEIEAVH
jgi:hypothetical protein